jgi:hypothetical protein
MTPTFIELSEEDQEEVLRELATWHLTWRANFQA